MARARLSWLRRGRPTRGTAALEFAFVAPVFFGTLGMCIAIGLGSLAHLEMMDMTHVAVRSCAGKLDIVQDVSRLSGCVGQTLQQNMRNFSRVCTLNAPVVVGPQSQRGTTPYVYVVKASLSCPFTLGLPLTAVLGAGANAAFTVSASASASALPRYAP